MIAKFIILFLGLVAILSRLEGSIEWTTWDRSAEEVYATDSQFSPDGKLHLLFVEDEVVGVAQRVVKLATVVNGNFNVETIQRVGNVTDSSIEHGVRLVGNENRMWAVWRKKLGAGASTIHAAQVYPRSGPLSIEVVDNNHSFNRFDASIGSDGLPRVVFIDSPNFRLGMVRREAHGAWSLRYTLAVPSFGDLIYREVALASQDGELSLFYVLNENPSGGGVAPYTSKLVHRRATEPVGWSSLAFGSEEVLATGDSAFELNIAFGTEAMMTGGGKVAVVYGNTADSKGYLATRSSGGVWTERSFVDVGAGIPRGTDLALAPNDELHVVWKNTLNQLFHRVWNGSSFTADCQLTGMTTFEGDLEVGEDNFPRVSSASTDRSMLQVSLPIDITDEDGDGVTYLMERAFRMNPSVPDLENYPMIEIKTYEGEEYYTITYLGSSLGGTGVNPYFTTDYEYHTEVSTDLLNWSSSSADVVQVDRFTIAGRGTVNVHRSATPIGGTESEYFRIRVVRR